MKTTSSSAILQTSTAKPALYPPTLIGVLLAKWSGTGAFSLVATSSIAPLRTARLQAQALATHDLSTARSSVAPSRKTILEVTVTSQARPFTVARSRTAWDFNLKLDSFCS